jgi:hypothetical protein
MREHCDLYSRWPCTNVQLLVARGEMPGRSAPSTQATGDQAYGSDAKSPMREISYMPTGSI